MHHYCRSAQKTIANMKALTLIITLLLPLSIFAQSADSLQLSQSIDEVIVTGTKVKTDQRLLSTTVTIIERNTIDSDHRTSLLPTLTEQIPGLFITSRGVMGYGVSTGAAGGMTMRGVGGSPTTGMMVLIDGHPQYMGLMGHPMADAYNSAMAERVEILRGPASVLYGSNAMGGVINIITRNMKQSGSHTDANIGYGSYNTLQTNVTNRTHKGAFTSAITGGYNRSDGHRDNMGFEQYNGSARLGLELSPTWDVAANINFTHFNASNPGTVSAPIIDNDSRITRYATSFSIRNHNDKTQGALSLFYNWGIHNINDGYSEGDTPPNYRFHSKDKMAGASWYQNFSPFNGNRTTVGVDYQFTGGKADNRYLDGSEDKTIADKYMHNIAGYISTQQSIRHWLMIDAGIRYDHNSRIGEAWVPQGGMTILLPRNMQVKAVMAKGFRYPTIREMYMFPPQNPDLQPEQIVNYEVSLHQQLRTVNYGVNVYYIDGKDMIQTQMVDGRPKNVNTGKVDNRGIEAEVSWQAHKRWRLMANYSYLHMKNPIVATPEHKIFFAVQYSHNRWSISSTIQQINGLITQREPLKKENYTLWNLSAEYQAAKRIQLYLHGENLLAQRYEINAGYPMPRATFNAGIKLSL